MQHNCAFKSRLSQMRAMYPLALDDYEKDDNSGENKDHSPTKPGVQVRKALRFAADGLFLVQTVVIQAAGAAFALGLLLNLSGFGYRLESNGLVVKPLAEMQQENADQRFRRAAARSVDQQQTDAAAAVQRLRGGRAEVTKKETIRVGMLDEDEPSAFARLHTHAEEIAHLALCTWIMWDAMRSVQHDQWHAVRVAPKDTQIRGSMILKRRRRAAQVGQLLGAGYTPRIVFLAGLMLRSLQMATAICRVFDPSTGYAAGAALAAKFSHREWLLCMLLGWGSGGLYWRAFRVRPPGVPKNVEPLRVV